MANQTAEDESLMSRVILEVEKIVHEKGGSLPPDISSTTNLQHELGFDSVDMLELTALLDQEFEIHLLQEDMIKAHSVEEIMSLVKTALKISSFTTIKMVTSEKLPLTDEEKNEITSHWRAIKDKKGLSKIGSQLLHLMSKALFHSYFKIEVFGEENIPKEGAFILSGNHVSHLDNFALIFAGNRKEEAYVFLAAKDYFFKKKSLSKILTSLINIVPFDRTGSISSFRNNLAYMEEAKKSDKVIVLFPEGTRSVTGKLNSFKPGVALFADQLNLKVVPVYIEGTYSLLPKGAIFPKPGKIKVFFGKPMSLENPYKDGEDPRRYDYYHHFMSSLKEAITNLKTNE